MASVRQLRAPMSSRLTQFLSAKGQGQHQQPSFAAAATPRHSEALDPHSPPLPEHEAAALALCQKHHEQLRLRFGSADAGEVVAEAAAAALVKEFCAAVGIASPLPSVFVYLFRRHVLPAHDHDVSRRKSRAIFVLLSSLRGAGMEQPLGASTGTRQSSSFARAGQPAADNLHVTVHNCVQGNECIAAADYVSCTRARGAVEHRGRKKEVACVTCAAYGHCLQLGC